MAATATILLFALLALPALTGCGEQDTEQQASAPENSDEPSSPAATTGDPPTGSVTEPGPEPGAAAEQGEEPAPRPTTVPAVVDAVLTASTDPEVICDELVSEDFVRQAYGAREGCIAAQRPGALADSVSSNRSRREGEEATVVAVPEGGPYDSVKVRIELIRTGDGWVVDALLADVPAGP